MRASMPMRRAAPPIDIPIIAPVVRMGEEDVAATVGEVVVKEEVEEDVVDVGEADVADVEVEDVFCI